MMRPIEPGMIVQRRGSRLDAHGSHSSSPRYRIIDILRGCTCAPYLYTLDCELNHHGSGCPGEPDGCIACPRVVGTHLHITLAPEHVANPRPNQLCYLGRVVQVNDTTLWELHYEHPARFEAQSVIRVLGWARDHQRTLFPMQDEVR